MEGAGRREGEGDNMEDILLDATEALDHWVVVAWGLAVVLWWVLCAKVVVSTKLVEGVNCVDQKIFLNEDVTSCTTGLVWDTPMEAFGEGESEEDGC